MKTQKLGRNDKCWCANGKKYKKCHFNTSENKRYWELVPKLGQFGARNQILSDSGIDLERELKIAKEIFESKLSGNRPKPNQYLEIKCADLPDKLIHIVLNIVAYTCDEIFVIRGRSVACIYFAIFLRDILNEVFNLDAKAIVGRADYTNKKTGTNFYWEHSWVEYNNQLIDGNVDSMQENPKVPDEIRPKNYWGIKKNIPNDRSFSAEKEINDKWIEENIDFDKVASLSKDLVTEVKKLSHTYG